MKKFLLALFLLFDLVFAKTLVVGSCVSGDDVYGTISAALSNAADGDKIYICAGEYNINSTLVINKKNLTIAGVGENIDDVVIKGNFGDYIMKITAGGSDYTVIRNLKIVQNSSAAASAVYADGNSNSKIKLQDLIVESGTKGIVLDKGMECGNNIKITSEKRAFEITPSADVFLNGLDISVNSDHAVVFNNSSYSIRIYNSIIISNSVTVYDSGIYVGGAEKITLDSVYAQGRRGVYISGNVVEYDIENSRFESTGKVSDEAAITVVYISKSGSSVENSCFYGNKLIYDDRTTVYKRNYYDGVNARHAFPKWAVTEKDNLKKLHSSNLFDNQYKTSCGVIIDVTDKPADCECCDALNVEGSAENNITAECGVFTNVLQTRKDPSKITVTGTSYIHDASSCMIQTGQINGSLMCDSHNAEAIGTYGKKMDIIYSQALQHSQASENPGGGSSKTVTQYNKTLYFTKYDVIRQDWNGYPFKWWPYHIYGNEIGVNKFEDILNKVTIWLYLSSDKDLKIGTFQTAGWGETNLALWTYMNSTPDNIFIYKIENTGSNKFTTELTAKHTIDINTLQMTSSAASTVTLKAPKVVLRKMDLTNNNNTVEIYADEIYVDEIDFGQTNKLYIHPYSSDKVKFVSRQINFSSSSQMILDSGDYYVDNINFSGSGSSIPAIKASSEDEKINLFINGDFEIPSNYPINSDGLNGNFGNNPAANFRIFVNGDFEVGAGGTTINALIYVEGETNIGSNTYVRGAISSAEDITIGNGAHFYWDESVSGEGWASCINIGGERDFSLRKYFNIRGDYKIIGNTVLCYKVNGQCRETSRPNNELQLSYVNVLGSPYINSTAAEISRIPDDAKILWVGFYTQGTTGLNATETAKRLISRPSYLIKPGKYNFTMYPQQIDLKQTGTALCNFSTFAEVKDLESDENKTVYGRDINGWWYAANIQNFDGNVGGQGSFGAWLMVVVYEDSESHLKNISVFDGYKLVYKNTVEIPVSGFITPKHGDVHSKVSVFTGEGDNKYTGDTLEMKTGSHGYVNLNRGTSYEYNAFHSGIEEQYNRDVNLTNNFGIDIQTYNVGTDGIDLIHNNDTSATLKFYSNGDAFLPSLFIFSTDLYEPRVCYFIESIKEGDTVYFGKDPKTGEYKFLKPLVPNKEYNLSAWISNMKMSSDDEDLETAEKTKIFLKYINTEYQPDTTYIKNIDWNSYRKITDREDSDIGMYDNEKNQSVWNVGENATFNQGGAIEPATDFNDNDHKVFVNVKVKFDVSSSDEGIDLADYLKFKATLRIPTINVNIDNAYTIPKCIDFNSTANIAEVGDYVIVNDTFAGDTYDANDTNYTKLHTQIVNRPFVIRVLHLGDDKTTLQSIEQNVTLQLVKGDECNSSSAPVYAQQLLEFNNISEYNLTFTYPKAIRDAAFRVKWETGGGDYNYSCSDRFAIRPYAFRIFGLNQYKRAGEEFNLTIKAVDESNYNKTSGTSDDVSGVEDYNESLSPLRFVSSFYAPTAAEVSQMQSDTGETNVTYCPNPGVFSVLSSANFSNGEINATFKFSETGVLSLNVSEINGSEFAAVDADDTNDSQRFIKPADEIVDINDLSKTDLLMFIPYKFITTAEYNTTKSADWVYMSNDVNKSQSTYTTPNMAAYINYTIKAYGKDGNILQNYTSTCFPDIKSSCPQVNGLKLNTTFDLFLDADVISSRNTVISVYSEDKNANAIYTINSKLTLSSGSNLLREWVSPLNFENGVGVAKVYFNIDKNYSSAVPEVNLTLSDANTSTSWMSQPGATNQFIGASVNKTITFKYGRIKVRNVAGYANEVNTTFEYQYWKDNEGWVSNTDHNGGVFGDVNEMLSYMPGVVLMSVTTPGRITNGDENVSFSLDTSKQLPPYSAKIHLYIKPWLWYHPLAKNYQNPSANNTDCLTHPCMKVDFLKTGSGWGGVDSTASDKFSENNRTSEVNASGNIDTSKSQVKKLNW